MPSDLLVLSRVAAEDLADVEAVFDDLRNYSNRIGGVRAKAGAAIEFVTAHPPGVRIQNKHAFVARRDGRPVGVLDIIDGYPTVGCAFIGLLAVRESLHGVGLGRALYGRAEEFIKGDLAARDIRIAVVEANPVSGFWTRMGFKPTGDVRPYDVQAVTSRLIVMEKSILSASSAGSR